MMHARIAAAIATLLILGLAALPASAAEARKAEAAAPAAPGEILLPTPSPRQLAWQELEIIAFAHFGVNTFTNKEWGNGKEDPKVFNPAEFDARQWTRALKAGGVKMLILTAKHHDGFCLWPSAYTDHSVKSSTWRDGKGDVVREVAEACRLEDLKFGIYLSPWDRHEKTYGDSPKYNQHFVNQLYELLQNYGEVSEIWFDGACGEGPNGKRQEYDFPSFIAVVRKCAPGAVIFSDAGPDVRWVGNEKGYAGETCWSTFDRSKVSIGKANTKYLNKGDPGGPDWVPAECDVSIRPGWFYHPAEDDKVKSLEQLLDIYYGSVGRNGVLLLNVPPDTRGLIHENDAARLKEFRKVLDETFKANLARSRPVTATSAAGDHAAARAVDGSGETWWQAADGTSDGVLTVDLGGQALFNVVSVQEMITQGQRVEEFRVEAWDGAGWREVGKGTTVGYKRLLRVGDVRTDKVRLAITKSRGAPTVREFGLYLAPPLPGK
ncbi:MAG: alpha-L-fucosidase [Planctomycetota bacterium]|nr:alpha-L-fucosidase [Planctomycetota bacterium]